MRGMNVVYRWKDRNPPMRETIVGCDGSGHTRLREHEQVLTLTVYTLHSISSRGSIISEHHGSGRQQGHGKQEGGTSEGTYCSLN